MSDEIDAAGALATPTLTAASVEGAAPAEGVHGAHCANCGAVLAGAYCNACGQPAHVHRSLLHLVEEVLHGTCTSMPRAGAPCPCWCFAPAC